jgi:flagellar protein FlaI
LGFEDPRDIYDELKLRARIVEEAVRRNMLGPYETFDLIRSYRQKGRGGLPFKI